jgi:pentatricopeptide repeat protein
MFPTQADKGCFASLCSEKNYVFFCLRFTTVLKDCNLNEISSLLARAEQECGKLNVFLFSVSINRFSQAGRFSEAIKLYRRMHAKNVNFFSLFLSH